MERGEGVGVGVESSCHLMERNEVKVWTLLHTLIKEIKMECGVGVDGNLMPSQGEK